MSSTSAKIVFTMLKYHIIYFWRLDFALHNSNLENKNKYCMKEETLVVFSRIRWMLTRLHKILNFMTISFVCIRLFYCVAKLILLFLHKCQVLAGWQHTCFTSVAIVLPRLLIRSICYFVFLSIWVTIILGVILLLFFSYRWFIYKWKGMRRYR